MKQPAGLISETAFCS